MKNQITDLISAVKDEGINTLLSSEVFKEAVVELGKKVVEEQAANLIGGLLSAASPRVYGIILSYKQNRFERNMTRLVKELTRRIEDLEINYAALSDDMKELYKTQFTEMLLDSAVDERQEEKIKWGVNGFVNMMTDDSNENIMQIFFDTLMDLTVLDVDTLKMHHIRSDLNIYELQIKYNIDYDRVKLVKEKLARLGLLSRKNDDQRDKNIDEITEYLQKVEQDSKRSKPQGGKLPSGIKKISNNDSYSITRLGSGFLASIGEV